MKVPTYLFAGGTFLSFLNFCLWMLLGLIWRYTEGGRIASGDKLERLTGILDEDWKEGVKAASKIDGYQVKSGTFMQVSLITLVTTIVLMSLTWFSLSCYRNCTDKTKDNDKEDGRDSDMKTQ